MFGRRGYALACRDAMRRRRVGRGHNTHFALALRFSRGGRRAGCGCETDATAPAALKRYRDVLRAALAQQFARKAACELACGRLRSREGQNDQNAPECSLPGFDPSHWQYCFPLKTKHVPRFEDDDGGSLRGAAIRGAGAAALQAPSCMRISPFAQVFATQRPLDATSV